MKTIVIIPAYNEAEVIAQVIRNVKDQLKKFGNSEIVVVDDGSSDDTAKEALRGGVTVLSHPLNRGLGGALGTGLAYAKKQESDLTITFDADGQHDAKDIYRVVKPILAGKADVVIGSRTLKGMKNIPIDRRIIIWGSNLITWLLFGIRSSDSQSGFRAFSKTGLEMLMIKTQGMEVSSEIFSEIKNKKLRLKEVPINVIYTDYSRKKGQSNLNAVAVLVKLLLRLARE